MDYNQARTLIEDGDIVQVRTAHSLFGWLTKLFTGVYVHTGMAVWLDTGLWLVEINGGGNHIVPLSQLNNKDYDVYSPPSELSPNELKRIALNSIRTREDYGFAATIMSGINEFLLLNRFIHWRDQLHCTGYVIKILEGAGWAEHSYITSPTALSRLLTIKLKVRNL